MHSKYDFSHFDTDDLVYIKTVAVTELPLDLQRTLKVLIPRLLAPLLKRLLITPVPLEPWPMPVVSHRWLLVQMRMRTKQVL